MDPRSSVRPGQPLALAAEQVNWINRQMRGNSGFGGSAIGFFGAPYTWAYAKNDTGADVPRWGVMEITGLAVVPTDDEEDAETQQFCAMPVLVGGEIEVSADKWCVALEPIADDKLGRVAIAGAVQVAKADLDKLDGAFVYWEDDNWALVGRDGVGALKLCKTTDEWGIDEIATLDVWHDGTPPTEQSSGETVQAVNKVAPVGTDTFVLVGKAGNGSWYLVEIGRDCADGLLAKRLTEEALDDTVSDSPLETGDGPQILIHNAGCLKWASLKKIEVIVGVSLTSEGLEFERDEIWTFPDVNSALENTIIEVTDCPPPE